MEKHRTSSNRERVPGLVDSELPSVGIGICGAGESTAGGNAPPLDDCLVDWEGPDDHQNPQNWTRTRKWTIIISVSAITFNQYVSFPAGRIIAFWC